MRFNTCYICHFFVVFTSLYLILFALLYNITQSLISMPGRDNQVAVENQVLILTHRNKHNIHTHTHTSHPLLCRPRLLFGVSIFQNTLIKYDTIKLVSDSKGILSNDGTMNIVCLAGCTSQGHKRSSDPADVLICHIWMNTWGAKQNCKRLQHCSSLETHQHC